MKRKRRRTKMKQLQISNSKCTTASAPPNLFCSLEMLRLLHQTTKEMIIAYQLSTKILRSKRKRLRLLMKKTKERGTQLKVLALTERVSPTRRKMEKKDQSHLKSYLT